MSEGFDSDKVARLRRSPWGIGCSTVGILLSLFTLAVLAYSGRPVFSTLASLVGLCLAALFALLHSCLQQFRDPTRVRANRQGAWIGDEFVPRSAIGAAVLLQRWPGPVVRIVRRARMPIEIAVNDEVTGDRLIRALGQDVDQTLENLEIGADGVLVRTGGRARYIHHGTIEAVLSDGEGEEARGVKLVLAGGDIVEVRCPGPDRRAQVAFVLRRMKQAREAFASKTAVADASILSRGDRSVGDWVAHLRALGLGAGATHRTAPVVPERLWRVLEDPRTLPSARAAAAVALGPTLDAEARARLRATAAVTTAPKLRIALGTAADTEEAAELEAILAAVEPEDGKGTV